MSDEFKEEIRQRVLERLGKAEANQVIEQMPTSAPEPAKEGVWMYVFTGFILLFSVLTLGSILYVKASTKNGKSQQPIAEVTPAMPSYPPGLTMDEVQSSIRPMFDAQNQKLDDMKKRMDVISHRQWLLGVAHNENVCVSESGATGFQGRYITLDEDWKLSRVPEYLKMSEEDRQRLIDATRK